MADPVRVLIVDKEAVVRRALVTAFGEDPRLHVVAAAATVSLGRTRLERDTVHVIVLDPDLPEAAMFPGLAGNQPVVLFASSDRAVPSAGTGVVATVFKPDRRMPEELEAAARGLIPRLLDAARGTTSATSAFGADTPAAAAPRPGLAARPSAPAPRMSDGGLSRCNPSIIAIGSSTGGPEALAFLLEKLPGEFPVPIVIAQHIPPDFSRMLAERLSARSALHVAEARDGDIPEAGHVYLAPGDHHMRIVNRLHGAATRPTIALDRGERENSCRPAVDPLFRSLADLYGSRLLAVVLTGMGQDGMLGAGAIKKAGGHVIVQDEATSVIWGMPGSVVTAGSADAILPLADIPTQLLASTGGPLARLAAVFGTS